MDRTMASMTAPTLTVVSRPQLVRTVSGGQRWRSTQLQTLNPALPVGAQIRLGQTELASTEASSSPDLDNCRDCSAHMRKASRKNQSFQSDRTNSDDALFSGEKCARSRRAATAPALNA
eukprot:SAG31_NODE_17292_length_676_cov_1.332756_1_plen_118_part_10